MSTHTINPIPSRSFKELQARPRDGNVNSPRGLSDPTENRLNESLQREFSRGMGLRKTVRPTVITGQRLLNQIRSTNVLDGNIVNIAPDQAAAGSMLALVRKLSVSSSLEIRRGFLQFADPIQSFRTFTLFTFTGSFSHPSVTSFEYSIELDFITTEDFKIADLTWNNQGSLSFEKLALFPKLFDVSMSQDTDSDQTLSLRYGLPLGNHALASGKAMTGMRIKFTTETDLGGTFWSYRAESTAQETFYL